MRRQLEQREAGRRAPGGAPGGGAA
jgi:hypothetical protein